MPGTRTGRADWPWATATPALTLVLVRRAVDELTADDRLILWPDELWPQDVGVLSVLDGSSLLESDGRFRIEVAREAIEKRGCICCQVPPDPLRAAAWPGWSPVGGCPHFDLLPSRSHSFHSRRRGAASPDNRTVAPAPWTGHGLWEAWFLPGLPDDRIGMFVRLHGRRRHCGVAALGALLDVGSDVAPALPQPWTPAPRPDARDLLADNLQRQVNNLVAGWRWSGGRWHWFGASKPPGRPCASSSPKNPARGPVSTALSVPTERSRVTATSRVVEDVAHAHAATVNDVLLTMIAGLRARLHRGERIEDVNPRSRARLTRRDRAARAAGNLISQMIVHLPLGIADPACQAAEIAARPQDASRPRSSLGTMFHGKVTRLVMLRLVIRRVDVVTADLPGPQQPLYFAGSQLLEIFPLVNLLERITGGGCVVLCRTVQFDGGQRPDAYPDLDVFLAGARDEFRHSAKLPPPARSTAQRRNNQ